MSCIVTQRMDEEGRGKRAACEGSEKRNNSHSKAARRTASSHKEEPIVFVGSLKTG